VIKNSLSRREFLAMASAGLAAAAVGGCDLQVKKRKPNFIFILIDDLGWKDVGAYGSSFYETPHIDRLAAQGMRFTDAYAACPVCSPTRASIMTGKYPVRVGITDWIPGDDPKNRKLLGPQDLHQMPLKEKTIAEVLEEAGYKTAFFGKWHLGDKGYHPEQQGFQINKGGHWAGQPASYFYPYKNEQKRWDVPGLEGGKEGEYLTDRLTEEAIAFMRSHKDAPFLLYLSHYAVHTPIQSKPELVEKYQGKLQENPSPQGPEYLPERESASKQIQDDPAYAGMVESVDQSVGRITAELEELGLEEDTIIIFMSDNGGLSTLPKKWKSPTSNVPLRAGKGWQYEGGIREPMIIKWPGEVRPGSVCSLPVISMDFYPTMLEMAGLGLRPKQHVDGVSLVPLLKEQVNESGWQRKAIFWHFPHYHGSGNTPAAAVRTGKYKLIEWFEDGSVELYDLEEDIGETRNLAETMPNKRDELLGMMRSWRHQIGAKLPQPNPDYKE